MILYGEMVCGIECGRWEYKVTIYNLCYVVYTIHGCTLSPTLFLIFVNGLMKEIESKVSS